MTYKALVQHGVKSDYIHLSKLPVEMVYMVYFLQRTMVVRVHDNGTLDTVSIKKIEEQDFIDEMKDLL